MARSVEEKLMAMLGEAKGGSAEIEGVRELKLLKERQASMFCRRQGCLLLNCSVLEISTEAFVRRMVIDLRVYTFSFRKRVPNNQTMGIQRVATSSRDCPDDHWTNMDVLERHKSTKFHYPLSDPSSDLFVFVCVLVIKPSTSSYGPL